MGHLGADKGCEKYTLGEKATMHDRAVWGVRADSVEGKGRGVARRRPGQF
jgi:hypothetical protein